MSHYTQEDFMRDIEADFRNARGNKAQKKKIRELMERYGNSREEIEAKSSMGEWFEFVLANGDALWEEVRREKLAEEAQNKAYDQMKARIEAAKKTREEDEVVEEEEEEEEVEEDSSIDYARYGNGFSRTFINEMLEDERFQRAMEKHTRLNEGGLANHANDRGGLTNYGISSKFYPDEDIAHLTPERAAAIMYRDYWRNTKIYQLPEAFSDIVFDDGVVQGQGTAIKNIQKALGVKADGIIGPETLEAFEHADFRDVKDRFIQNAHRIENLNVQRDPSQRVFERGHRNRFNRYY